MVEEDPYPELSVTPPDEVEVDLEVVDGDRLVAPVVRRRGPRGSFYVWLALAFLFHTILIAAFFWRDRHETMQVAQLEETPVEIVVEKPPEPEKPPPPPVTKPPPPPKPPKEELEKPAFSAPRAPNEERVETERTQPKTLAPKAPTPPAEGQPQPKPAVAQPKEAAPDQNKREEAAKEEDKTKPDAEALDKAKQKAAKPAKTKEAKAAPKRKQKPTNALAALSGASALPDFSFAKPTPKSPVYGGTEDVRYLAIVEGMLEAKVGKLPHTQHWQAGGNVLIFFHIDESGRVISSDFYTRSGYPDIDQLAMRALRAAAPFPPPPRGVEHGLLWGSTFDGIVPTIHVTKK